MICEALEILHKESKGTSLSSGNHSIAHLTLDALSRRVATASRSFSSWRRVVPYLLARLSYQVRMVRSMVAKWSATSFSIRSAEHADGLGWERRRVAWRRGCGGPRRGVRYRWL